MKTRWITRSLLGIGLASLFSDFSHAMITAVLPTFLPSIGAGEAALGVIEGSANALSSFVKVYRRYLGAVSVFGVGSFSHSLLIPLATTALAPRFGASAATIAASLDVLHNAVFASLA